MLTEENVLTAIEQVIRLKGADFRYAEPGGAVPVECMNAYDPDHPGCIIGWIIWLTDAGLFQQIATDKQLNYASVMTLQWQDVLKVEGGVDGPLSSALRAMQGAQDRCATWGEAVEKFHETLAFAKAQHERAQARPLLA